MGGNPGLAPYPGESRYHQPISCRLKDCPCTHTEGCEAGWIDSPGTGPRREDEVKPCPRCRPGLAVILAEAAGDRLKAQIMIRDPEKREAARNASAWND